MNNTYQANKPKQNTKRKRKIRLSNKGTFVLWVALSFLILFVFSVCVYAMNTNLADASYSEVIEENIPVDLEIIQPAILTTNYDDTKTEIVAEPLVEKSITYSEDDLYYLAAAVCREAGGQSEEIQLLVANVIMNRVKSDLYPNTIYGVLTQRMQYDTMWKYGVSFPKWATKDIKNQCYSVAKRVLEGEIFCPDNVLFQAEFKQGSGVFKYFNDGYYFCYY